MFDAASSIAPRCCALRRCVAAYPCMRPATPAPGCRVVFTFAKGVIVARSHREETPLPSKRDLPTSKPLRLRPAHKVPADPTEVRKVELFHKRHRPCADPPAAVAVANYHSRNLISTLSPRFFVAAIRVGSYVSLMPCSLLVERSSVLAGKDRVSSARQSPSSHPPPRTFWKEPTLTQSAELNRTGGT